MKNGTREEGKALSVAMLYANYAGSFGTKDEKLYAYANLIISRSVLKKSNNNDWKELISDLDIKKRSTLKSLRTFLTFLMDSISIQLRV